MTRIENVRACVFDAYGTLFNIHAPTATIAGDLGDVAQPLSETWRQKQLQYTWLRSLMGEHADFWRITGDALDFAMAAHGVGDPGIRQRLMDLYEKLEAYPDATAALKELKDAGYKTAILSNGAPKMLDAAVRNSGLGPLLDETISIEDAGIYKPAPRVYQLAVDRLGVKPGEICFVSANTWDVAGAANFGFQVAHIGRFGQPLDKLPGEPKVIMKELTELPALVGK